MVDALSRRLSTGAGETLILDDVSFAVPYRSLFCIAGPSGSGKSTLLNIITGIDHPDAGTVSFEGQPVHTMTDSRRTRWRGRALGIVYRFFQLIPTLSARENILLALELGRAIPRKDWGDRAADVLRLVGMEAHADRLPDELSGRQQQRIAIARALANDPPVLVADEPTGNLDSAAAQDILDLLAALSSRDKTVIYATHDVDLAARATDYVRLRDGRVTERSYGAVPGIYE